MRLTLGERWREELLENFGLILARFFRKDVFRDKR